MRSGLSSGPDAGLLLSIAGIVLSLLTMLSSSWLSLVPLLLVGFSAGFQNPLLRIKGGFRLKFSLLGLILTVLLATAFILASIPPIYLSWISLFAHIFLLSLRDLKLTAAFIVAITLFIPALFYLGGYITVSSYNIIRVADPEELKGVFRSRESVVLVGHAMAEVLAKTRLTPNEKIVDWEEIAINGTPYWIFAVTPANTIAQNYVSKLILVHVQTGEVLVKEVHMTVGSGLWWTNNVRWRTYLLTAQPIGNVYPFVLGEEPYFAACSNKPINLGLSIIPGEIYVYRSDGSLRVVQQFSGDRSLPEDYDWDYLDGYIKDWLYFLAETNPVSFTIIPRGFLWIPASQHSQDLLNMTLLIPGKEGGTLRVYFGTSPANPNSIVSILIANNTGVYYYDVKRIGIYSPHYVQSLVQSKLPAISGGRLYAKYAQLVYIDGYLWIVPIYALTSVTTLWGVAVVNATNPQQMQIYQYSPSYGAYTDFLRAVFSAKLSSQENMTCRIVEGIISQRMEFVYRGDTYLALAVGNSTYYAMPDIGLRDFLKLLAVRTGDYIKLCVSDDRIVRVVEG